MRPSSSRPTLKKKAAEAADSLGLGVPAIEEVDDPASVGRMDPEGQRDQVVPAAEGPGSEAKAVEALDLVDRADRVVEALEAAGRSEHHPARVCP